MRLLVRSALRVWTRRPAGPVLVALGVLAATLSAAGADLALDGARQAERAADRAELGDTLARVHTPGGFTVDETTLEALRSRLAGDGAGPPERRLPVYLARDATITTANTTTAGWRVLGLPRASLEALELGTPAQGAALVDPGPRPAPGDRGTLRVQAAPDEEVRVVRGFNGQLAQTARASDEYVHDDGDQYVFEPNVTAGAGRLEAYLATADDDTDFDLELESPSGATWLYDNGTAAQPVQPNASVPDPEGGTWTIRVHAKLARNEAFRLQVVQVFDARDAQAISRLLQGEGFRAVGAQLGLTRLAELDLDLRPADLSTLGPAPGGLVVLPLDRLQAALDLEGLATGLLVRAGPDDDPLAGLGPDRVGDLRGRVEAFADERASASDPARGLTLTADADDRRREREGRLDSTGALLFAAVPAAILAGVLLATWAAGLHTRRLANETTVLAGLGQSRARSWAGAGLHLGPAFALGAAAGLALSPLAGELISRGLGLATTATPTPDASTLLAPGLALAPVAGTAYLSLRGPVRGADPRVARRPRGARARWLVAGLSAIGALGLLGLALGPAGPAGAYLAGAAAAAGLAWALHWTPLRTRLLGARGLVVDALGLLRTRSTHASLGLAAAAAALVVAALVAGTGLSGAAQPDVAAESGGYAVVAETPRNVNSYAELEGAGAPDAALLDQPVGVEFLMRVAGANIHDASTGRLDTVYGIDSSFAQRHRHPVRSLDPDVDDPVRAVADSQDRAVVSTSVAQALDGDQVVVSGPGGQLAYDVVGVLETRLLEGVYISKNALPSHFSQVGGEQRVRLPADVDAARYARTLQTAFREEGLAAATADQLVERRLDGQRRAGRTLQAVAALGGATLLGLVALLGLRARAERRSSDAVLGALGARPRSIAAGIATETLLPVLVGSLAGLALTLPLVDRLADLSGLAFPLAPIDGPAVALAAGATAAAAALLALVVGALVGVRAARDVDQRALRQLE